MVITLVLSIALLLLILVYRWTLEDSDQYFSRRNLPSPPAHFFFFGHLENPLVNETFF